MSEWIWDVVLAIGVAAVIGIVWLAALVLFAYALSRVCDENVYCKCPKCEARKEREAEETVSRGSLIGTARYYTEQAAGENLTSQERDDALAMARWLEATAVNGVRRAYEHSVNCPACRTPGSTHETP